ncbi:acyltransferase 3, partial [Achlya hypogyna]
QTAYKAQVGVTIVSFVVNVLLLGFKGSNKYAFYLPFARFWQMAIGGVLAHWTMNNPPTATKTSVYQMLATALALVLLIIGFVFLTEASAFPGWWALLPTLGAAILIGAGPSTLFHDYVLANRVMVFVGKISYALYLWHWPLLVFTKALYPIDAARPWYVSPWAMIVASFALSYLAYLIVETPLRRLKAKWLVPTLAGVMLIMTALATATYLAPASFSYTQVQLDRLHSENDVMDVNEDTSDLNSSRGPQKEPPTYLKIKAAQEWLPDLGYTEMPADSPFKPTPLNDMQLNPGKEDVLFVIGDSHADMIKPRFYQLLLNRGPAAMPTIMYKSKSAVPSLACEPGAYSANIELVKALKPKAFLHVTYWQYYLRAFGGAEGAAHNPPMCCSSRSTCDGQTPADVTTMIETFTRDMAELTRLGVKVFVATLSPEGPEFDPENMVQGSGVGKTAPVSLSEFRAKHKELITRLEGAIHAANATIIDFSKNQCDEDVCQVIDQYGNPIMKDTNHFRPSYARKAPVDLTPTPVAVSDDVDATLLEAKLEAQPPSTHLKYRPDIDGLRTVAIVPVLIFHAYPSAFPSGFIGVDIFFVISGFLISSILFKEMTAGTFTYANFYSRRIRRIYPVLLVVLATTWGLGCAYHLATPLKRLAATMLAGTLFGANLQVLSLEEGYFDASVKEDALLHLWSLGVEEQFYIFWPMLLTSLVALPKGLAFKTQLFVCVHSFLVNVLLLNFKGSNKYAFYLPFARFWQMAIGGMLAHWSMHRSSAPSPMQQMLLTTGGIGLLIAGFVLLTEDSMFPGWWALLPTLGAALLIGAGPSTPFHDHVLSNSGMVFIGKISYALYLWHWPLLVFAKAHYPDAESRPWFMAPWAVLVTAALLSMLSYVSVETPLRRFKSKWLVPLLALAMLCMSALAAATYVAPASFSRTQIELDAMLAEPQSDSIANTTSSNIPHALNTTVATNVSKHDAAPHASVTSAPSSAPVATKAPGPNSSRGPLLAQPTYLKIMAAHDWNPNVGYEALPADSPFTTTALTGLMLNPGKDNIVFAMGDSHANMVKPRFYQLLQDRGADAFPTVMFKADDAMPILSCRPRLYDDNLALVKKLKPKVFLHVNYLRYYLRATGPNAGVAHSPPFCCQSREHCEDQTPADVTAMLSAFTKDMRELAELGTKVFVATFSPEGPAFNPDNMVRGSDVGKVAPMSRAAYRREHQAVISLLEAAIVAANATMIDFSENQCDGDVCHVIDRYGNPIMKDEHHFRPGYARKYLSVVDQVIDAAMQ